MSDFAGPEGLTFNRGRIEDPEAFARDAGAAAWLESLPRPTLVTCRTGPRSSALTYLHAGLTQGASADEVIAKAEADQAPFARSDELKAWLRQGLEQLAE
jgi:hypothetical protein